MAVQFFLKVSQFLKSLETKDAKLLWFWSNDYSADSIINGINKNHEYYPFMCYNICMKGGIIYEKFGFAWTEIRKIESH